MYSLLVLTSMSWPLYLDRFASRSWSVPSSRFRVFCEVSSEPAEGVEAAALRGQPRLELGLPAGNLGEVTVGAPQLALYRLEPDQTVEVGDHRRRAFYRESAARADARRRGWWAWKDSNLRLAGYEPAVLTN